MYTYQHADRNTAPYPAQRNVSIGLSFIVCRPQIETSKVSTLLSTKTSYNDDVRRQQNQRRSDEQKSKRNRIGSSPLKLQAWRKVLAAYRRVYDSRHLQADCQERDQLGNPTLGNRVWATFTFLPYEIVIVRDCQCSRSLVAPMNACSE